MDVTLGVIVGVIFETEVGVGVPDILVRVVFGSSLGTSELPRRDIPQNTRINTTITNITKVEFFILNPILLVREDFVFSVMHMHIQKQSETLFRISLQD